MTAMTLKLRNNVACFFIWIASMFRTCNTSLRDPKDGIKQAKNDKPGEHPPTPFKGGTFGHSSPFERSYENQSIRLFRLRNKRGQGDVSFCLSLRGGTTKQSGNKSVILVTLPMTGGRGRMADRLNMNNKC